MGPYYPVLTKPTHAGTDLTSVSASRARAKGQLLYLLGRVLNRVGAPLAGVEVEIWQANSLGRYAHPSDDNPAPLDPNFEGYGRAITDAEGGYRFKTIVPAGYPVAPGWDRPPHIHFHVTGRLDRQVTQMWFPQDPGNAQDRFWLALSPAERELVTAKMHAPQAHMEPFAKVALFDIVLPNG